MLPGDGPVVRVEHGRLHVAAEEIFRVAHEMLIKGILVADQHDQGFLPAAAHPAGALESGHY